MNLSVVENPSNTSHQPFFSLKCLTRDRCFVSGAATLLRMTFPSCSPADPPHEACFYQPSRALSSLILFLHSLWLTQLLQADGDTKYWPAFAYRIEPVAGGEFKEMKYQCTLSAWSRGTPESVAWRYKHLPLQFRMQNCNSPSLSALSIVVPQCSTINTS